MTCRAHRPRHHRSRRSFRAVDLRRRLCLESLEQRQLLTTIVQLSDDSNPSTFASVQDVSDDASRVVILSTQNTDDGNPDGNFQVLLQDRAAGTITQVTEFSRGNLSAPLRNLGGSITGDGSKVVFSSPDDLLPGNNADGSLEVYLYSLATGQNAQLTAAESGDSAQPVISSDGQWAAFASTADLTGSNADGNREIFRVNTVTLAVQQVTASAGGESLAPAIDADGSRIAFQSTADLTGDNSDGSTEIFLYDADTGSVSQITSAATGTSESASLDDSGAWIAFRSDAGLVTTSTQAEVLLYDVYAGTLEQITDGATSGQMPLVPRISANGQRVSCINLSSDVISLTVSVHDIPTGAEFPVAETVGFFTPTKILQMYNWNAFAAPISETGSEVTFSLPDDVTGMNSDESLELFAATDFETVLIDDAVYSIDENSPEGTAVGQLQPVDPGTELEFSISGGNSSGIFAIDSATGEITMQSIIGLDHEEQSEYTLTVKAISIEVPETFDFASVLIQVADVNESPELAQSLEDQLVYAEVAWDFTVPSWKFEDVDADDVLTFSALQEDGTPLPAWLDFDSDTLTFSGTPSAGDVGEVMVTLTANDSGDPSLSADDTFKISIAENSNPWQNPFNQYDVNAKDGVTPQDALIVINQLNKTGAGELPASGLVAPPYLDVSGNNHLEPLDALQVINYLNRQLDNGAEGELGETEPMDDAVAGEQEANEGILATDALAERPTVSTSDELAPAPTTSGEDTLAEPVPEIYVGESAKATAASHDEVFGRIAVEDLMGNEMEGLLATLAEE